MVADHHISGMVTYNSTRAAIPANATRKLPSRTLFGAV